MAKERVIYPSYYQPPKKSQQLFKREKPSPQDLSRALTYILIVSVPFVLILLGIELYFLFSKDHPIHYDFSKTTSKETKETTLESYEETANGEITRNTDMPTIDTGWGVDQEVENATGKSLDKISGEKLVETPATDQSMAKIREETLAETQAVATAYDATPEPIST